MKSIEHILEKFDFAGELINAAEFGSGHINSTFLAEYNDNGAASRYVVQRVNTNVFKSIDDLMENVFAVTSFLKNKIIENNGNPERETLNYIKTKDGSLYYKSENGECYRAYRFVDNSMCHDSVENACLFEKSGAAFGKFQRYLSDFPAKTLKETIANFHNTGWRFENEFLPAVESDIMGRAAGCQEEIDFIKARSEECKRLTEMAQNGEIPIRVTHNDTKLNNVLFDKDSNDAVCVIDLDTVMPGLALYDFGDAIRYGANTCAEDEADTTRVAINLDYFRAYAKGFLSEAGDSLNKAEKDNLAFSSKLMTLECAMRFLTDYLNGDTYFKTAYDKHNLVRARNQLALVADMEKHMTEMEEIIREL